MELIFGSILENLIKFVFYILVAWAGIVCGKKYKNYKMSKTVETSTEKKESK